MRPRIGAVHDGLVGPLEVEGVDQCLAHPRIPELVAARVDEPSLRAGRRVVGHDLPLDATVLHGRKIITRRPDAGGELLAVEIVLAGETFESDIAVAIEFVAHHVEIVAAAAGGQIGSPPILDALVFDVAIDLELADLVRPRTQGDLERRFVERTRGIIGFREDRQPRDIERHVARASLGEGHDQRRIVDRFRADHVAHLHDDQRMALGLQRRQRKRRVMRGEFVPSWNFASGRIVKR